MPLRAVAVTDISDMSESELEREVEEVERSNHPPADVDGERDGDRSTPGDSTRNGSASTRGGSASTRDGSASTKSTDRPSSSDSLKTASSGHTDQSTGEAGSTEESESHKDNSKKKRHQPTFWQSFKKAGVELNHDTRRAIRYIGRKLHRGRGPRETKVKEIHILPGEDDDTMWARRIVGSAHSRSSNGSDPVS